MTATAPPTLTDPGLSPDRSDRATFSARSIARDDFIKNVEIPERRLALTNVYDNAVDAFNNATAATASQTAAAASAAAAAATAGASIWISGTTYAIGDNRFSPINFQTYRRKTAGAGTVDPSIDATNWAAIASSNFGLAMQLNSTFNGI